ncbi:ADP-ribosylation factor-like protein 13A isoform X1 [Ranitomeya variabilis]|uniref:ADP-ribosylation factor-like protein 13A isoform X1 n=2 Tax=Ranitomeya variabilis TaxID=490064 RepID=UPI004056C89B
MEGTLWTSRSSLQHWTMFHLFSHCWRWVQVNQEPVRSVTIVFMGLEGAGKSSIIKAIKRGPPSQMSSLSDPSRTELRFDHFDLTLLELSSGQKTKASWRSYFSQAHALVFVVDASDHGRVQEVAGVLSSVLKHPRVSGKPLLILANKQDRASALLPGEIIEVLSLEKLVNENKTLCRIEPCSGSADFYSSHDWSTLKGLRWVLQFVTINYSTLSARISQDSAEQKESSHHKASVRPQNHSEVSGSDVTHDSSTELVNYKHAFPGGKRRPLKPIQNLLTQTGHSLRSMNKKRKRKVKVTETSTSQVLKVNRNGEGEQRAEDKTLPSSGAQVYHTLGHRAVIMPDTQDNPQVMAEGTKKRRKKKILVPNRQIKSLEVGAYSGDMENTFELYRKAIHALKLKQEQLRERPSRSNQEVSPLQ